MTFENTTHKVNLTGCEISTILYYLDEAIFKCECTFDEDRLRSKVDRIYAELQSVTDNYYAQLEAQDDNNYAECVDQLVLRMKANPNATNSELDAKRIITHNN
jgi:hypothetical protein